MAIKVKAVERLLKFSTESEGEYRFVMQAELYNKLSSAKVIQEASLRSGIQTGALSAAWNAIGEVVKAWATEGHSVAVPGLGTMRFGVRANSVTNVNEVAASLITSRRVIFTPSVDIKNELKRTSINITCFDRNGDVVKQVKSVDDCDVEDEENNPGSDQGNGNPAKKTLTLVANPTNGGTVNGAGQFDAGSSATITATPANGYTFSKWSDNNTNASRSVVVNSDMTLTAIFTVTNTGGGGNGNEEDGDA